MKKLICLLFSILLLGNVYSASQWDTTDPSGSESPSNLDDLITTNNDVVDRLLADYRQGAKISYTSATTLSISSGQVTCDNSARSLRKYRENTSATSVTFTNLDTGVEAASTAYYVYAVADADATTFTISISLSSTAPTGKTYYARLGSFYNNSSSDMEQVINDDIPVAGVSVSTGTIANGGTIPLPSGYIQSQCKWMVSVGTFTYGIGNGPSHPPIAATFTADSSRVVTATTAGGTGTANYIIVGVK